MTESQPRQIVIAGGGLSGVAAIETLRAQGYDGAIRLISEEAELPYDRPPLSKGYLGGQSSTADLLLHDAAWYRDQCVDLELGSRVTSIDAAHHQVYIGENTSPGIEFDRLLIAVGARARVFNAIPAEGKPGLRYLRTRADAEYIRATVSKGSHVILIGGGVIGLETAATLRHLGCEVTVLEAAERIMARFFPIELSQLLTDLHAARGIKIDLQVVVDALEATDAGWLVHLRGRPSLAADFVVLGIGVVPNSEMAAMAGLAIRLQGIQVDEHGQSASPGVYATGDVATFPMPDGQFARWENWTHARQHAATAARHMLGVASAYAEIPWIWSDQHEFNIQVTGSATADRVVMRGRLEVGRLTAFHLHGARIMGATTINDSRNKSSIRRLIERAAEVSPDLLADPTVDLKKLCAAMTNTVPTKNEASP